ncbi:MAG TPA: methyltransferase domain-containing protein [Paracoccaceae bacterium]|nr:methyltransferase domain-containing protein [Paracoccaceae bacterium]
MNELSLTAMEATAAAYEDGLVRALLRDCAGQLVEALAIRPGEAVLDVGCGTGIVARLAAVRCGASGQVTGLDPNPAMLAVASRLAPGIEWREGRAESLPWPDASFGAVASQFALMFFADRAAALAEIFRVLRPGGRLAVSVLDSLDANAGYAAMVAAFEAAAGSEVAGALRFPFILGDPAEVSALFARAGIPGADIRRHERTARFASVRDVALADIRGWFPFAGISLDEATIERVVAEAETRLAPFLAPDGSVSFPVFLHVVTARKV